MNASGRLPLKRRRIAYLLPPRVALNAIDLQWQNLANAAHVQH
jgi:hypothetical protein